MESPSRLPVPCPHKGCALPFGHVAFDGGKLFFYVRHRHHGVRHEGRVELSSIEAVYEPEPGHPPGDD